MSFSIGPVALVAFKPFKLDFFKRFLEVLVGAKVIGALVLSNLLLIK